MIGILIATHGGFAEGVLNAAELIAGNKEKITAIGLYHGDGVEEYERKILEAMKDLDDGDGVLALVDLLGGTPSNTMMKLTAQNYVRVVSGLNLPMLIHAIFSREDSPLEELCLECKKNGMESITALHEKIYEEHENDDF